MALKSAKADESGQSIAQTVSATEVIINGRIYRLALFFMKK
jgi:hypothetical protein